MSVHVRGVQLFTAPVDTVGSGAGHPWTTHPESSDVHMIPEVIHNFAQACEERNSSCPQVFPTLGTP